MFGIPKRLRLCVLLVWVLAPVVLWAQPQIYSVGNSASYAQGSIAQGSIFVVFGYGIGPAELQQANSYPLPSQLAGASVQVISGSTTLDCPMIYASFSQTAAILPSNTPLGPATVWLKYNGRTSIAGSAITVSSSAFGIYTVAGSGSGPGSITGADYALKGLQTSARPGETVILWGTGLGPIDGDDSGAPVIGPQFKNVEVFVGMSPAAISYAGRSGCCAGLDQIAIEIPNSVTGCFVPIVVRSGGAVSNFVTLPISAAGSDCPDSSPGLPTSLLVRALNGEELRLGAIAIGPIRVLQTAGFQFSASIAQQVSLLLHAQVSENDVSELAAGYRARNIKTVERLLRKYHVGKVAANRKLLKALRQAVSMDQLGAAAAFGTTQGLDQFAAQVGSHLIPPGTCIVTTEGLAPYSVHTRGLDAGATLNLSGPLGPRSMTEIRGTYQASLGSGFQSSSVPGGAYSVSGSGGGDVPAFTASLNVSSNLVWTNKAVVAPIDRSQPLTVTWSGATASPYVLIGGAVHSDSRNTTLLCVEDSGKGSFTVPDFVLSALPPGAAKDTYFFLAPHVLSVPVNIPGLDLAFFVNASSDYQAVDLR
ncbi:MAG TPA: hypothetical protein VMH05_15205 [Bryobacteraceae bacterium]|nr:hypothetical protein [Bryobacteraceae bacterium]